MGQGRSSGQEGGRIFYLRMTTSRSQNKNWSCILASRAPSRLLLSRKVNFQKQNNTTDAATLTLHAFTWLKHANTSNYIFGFLQNHFGGIHLPPFLPYHIPGCPHWAPPCILISFILFVNHSNGSFAGMSTQDPANAGARVHGGNLYSNGRLVALF